MIKGAARCLLLAVIASVLAPAAASAHATIVETTPTDTAVVRSAPRQVQMRWSESVDLGPHSIQLLDATGGKLKTPPATRGRGGASTAVLTLPPGLRNGTYVVAWRVVSADSHPVSGAFSFSVGAASAVVTSAPGQSSAAVTTADAIARAIAFAGLALTLGGACLLLLLWPEGGASARGRRLLWGGIGALVAGTVVVLLLQGPYATGGSLWGIFTPSLLSFSLSTRFGFALLARLALTVAFATLVWLALRRGTRDRALVAGAGACVVGLIATWTLTDHSRTGVQTWLGVPVASLHLLAMALWFGGLAVLLVCVLGRTTALHVSLVPVVPRFSRLALACFVVLGTSGVYLSWRQVGTLPALPATAFGRLLLIKSGIVVAIVGLAYFSRRAVGRGGSDADLARHLRRSVGGEAVLGVAVLGLTAVLVNTAPARVSYGPPLDVTVATNAGSKSGLALGRVQLKLDSTKQGESVADVYLVARNGSLFPAPELTARLIPAKGGVGPLRPAFAAAEPGHFVATRLAMPFAGHWTLRLEVRTSEIDESDVDIPVQIR
jgi:copper transport protein